MSPRQVQLKCAHTPCKRLEDNVDETKKQTNIIQNRLASKTGTKTVARHPVAQHPGPTENLHCIFMLCNGLQVGIP